MTECIVYTTGYSPIILRTVTPLAYLYFVKEKWAEEDYIVSSFEHVKV